MKRSINKRKRKRPRVPTIIITLADQCYSADQVREVLEQLNESVQYKPELTFKKRWFVRFLEWVFKL